MKQLYRHLHMPHELVIQFMVSFSRAEYALKSTDYPIGNESRVNPDWDKFANNIHEKFVAITDKSTNDASSYLLDNPPRKQVLKDNKIYFSDQVIDPKQRSTQQLFLMVRTVRNNLFHGGKFLPHGENESGRNQKLVESSLIVLNAGIDLHVKVRASYEN